MHPHPLRQIIESCDRAISAKDFESLMEHYSQDAALVVKPGMVATGIHHHLTQTFLYEPVAGFTA